LPSTLPAGRAAARTLMLSNTRDAISAERMAVAATAARVTVTIDGAIRMHVADLKEVVVLYGGKRPGKRKSVVAGAAPAGTWGSADDCDSIQRSFMNFERIVWPLYEAIGMRAAERGRFRVEDSEEVTWADVPPRFGLALAFDTLRGRGLGSEAILTTLSEACEAMHIKAQRTLAPPRHPRPHPPPSDIEIGTGRTRQHSLCWRRSRSQCEPDEPASTRCAGAGPDGSTSDARAERSRQHSRWWCDPGGRQLRDRCVLALARRVADVEPQADASIRNRIRIRLH
jgi:hypothetical protein